MMGQFPNENAQNGMENQQLPRDAILGASRYYTGIDWKELLFRLLENIHWIILAAILCAAAVGIYVKTAVTPIYQATSKIYIAGSETTISLSDIQLGSSLARDYQEVFKIWHVHEMVDERLNLDYSYSKLSSMVSISNPEGSHLLYINVQSPDPQEAKLLADTYAEVVQEFISEKMELRKPQLLEVAQLPTRPISPNISASVVRAFIFGAFLSMAVVVLLSLLDDKIRTGEDVEKASGLPTLGVIMRQEAAEKNDPDAKAPEDGSRIAVIHKDLALDYSDNETINSICSSILFAGKNIKKIAVTSYEADNGKTFLSLRIAASMANRGKTVLFIDGDLRKSALVKQYAISDTDSGLAHYLTGQCSLENVIYPTNLPNLYIVPTGRILKTPLRLLTSEDFDRLMRVTGKIFDMVIVDTPPIGVVIDAAEIAKQCDGSLLVLEYNRLTAKALRSMQRTLEQTQTPILGCVINSLTVKNIYQKRYYYKYGPGYTYYGSDGNQDGQSKPKRKKERQKK